MIKINHLRKEYPDVIPIKDVSTEIHKGDIISVIGPSGTGKSTLIRCINMLETPTSGEIIVDGVDITKSDCKINEVRKKMGMVFQSFNLFKHRTIIENVMLPPMDLLKMDKQTAYDNAIALLKEVGLESKAMNYPDELSGGQKQRVAIARALSMNPEIILFDEPTSALDPTMVGEVQAVIKDLARQGKTMIIVTHEMKFAKEICNRVFYMDNGGIYEDGTPEQIFNNPQKERTRRFIRKLKVFEASVESADFDFIGIVSEIEKYGFKNRINSKSVYRIQVVFEELCKQIIFADGADRRLLFTAEYNSEDESITVVVLYDGESVSLSETSNKLAYKLLNGVSEKIEQLATDEKGYKNKIIIKLK